MSINKIKVEKEAAENHDVIRMQEYSESMRVLLSTFDSLIERGFSKSDALEAAQIAMDSFFNYKTCVDGPGFLVGQQGEEEHTH